MPRGNGLVCLEARSAIREYDASGTPQLNPQNWEDDRCNLQTAYSGVATFWRRLSLRSGCPCPLLRIRFQRAGKPPIWSLLATAALAIARAPSRWRSRKRTAAGTCILATFGTTAGAFSTLPIHAIRDS